MRNKAFQEVLDQATPDVDIYVRLYGNIVARVDSILKEKGINQEETPPQIDKYPSEINKWINGKHDFTLRSIAKLEAELGETILEVTKKKKEHNILSKENAVNNEITIRKATIEDIKSLNLLFDNYRVFYKKESDLEASKEFLKERLKNNESEIFVAQYCDIKSDTKTEQKLVGFVQLYPIFSSTRLKRFWLLNDLFVSQDFRKKGISILLIEAAKKLAIHTQSAGLMLETNKNNIEGNHLYAKTGFELDTEHNFYYWNE